MNNIFLNLYYLLIINFSKINIITSIRYFLYHEENNWIKKFCIYIFKNNKDIWRVKPKVKSSGKTIDNDFTDIKSDNYIIAKFIYNSHPIKGSKYAIYFNDFASSIQTLKLYWDWKILKLYL